MSVPLLPTPELGINAVPPPHPGTRRVAIALGVLAALGSVLALLTLLAHAWPWAALYAALVGCAWCTWRAQRWARPLTVALAIAGMGQPAVGVVAGAGDLVPTLVFGSALAAFAGAAVTLLTRRARTWFAAAAARRSLGE